MRMLLRIYAPLVCCLLCLALPRLAAAQGEEPPAPVLAALEHLMELTGGHETPPKGTLDPALLTPLVERTRASAFDGQADAEVALPRLIDGNGVFTAMELARPLAETMAYLYNPDLPPYTALPAGVRVGEIASGEEDFRAFIREWETAPASPEARSVRYTETETTTPDAQSGAYYAYTLNRFFVYLPEQFGGPAFLSVGRLADERSSVGKKGCSVAGDGSWRYFYSGQDGLMSSGIGWADSFIYDTFTVYVLLEPQPGSETGRTRIHLYKWLRAGWRGFNMVKARHIREGNEFFAENLVRLLEDPALPAPSAIRAAVALLRGLPDAAINRQIGRYADWIRSQVPDHDDLDDEEFAPVIADYAASMSRAEAEAELLKDYLRGQLGLPTFNDRLFTTLEQGATDAENEGS